MIREHIEPWEVKRYEIKWAMAMRWWKMEGTDRAYRRLVCCIE